MMTLSSTINSPAQSTPSMCPVLSPGNFSFSDDGETSSFVEMLTDGLGSRKEMSGMDHRQRHDHERHSHCAYNLAVHRKNDDRESNNSHSDPEKRHKTVGSAISNGQNDDLKEGSNHRGSAGASTGSGASPDGQENLNHRNNGENGSAIISASGASSRSMTFQNPYAAIVGGEINRLVRVLQNSSVSKRERVSMTLHLKDIGDVKLNVRIEGKKVFIEAIVKSRQAAAVLSGSLDELKARLHEHKLHLAGFDIEMERNITPGTGHGTGTAVYIG